MSDSVQGKIVALVGRLASMSKRDAAQLLRSHGATVVERPEASVHLIVVGEAELPMPDGGGEDWLDALVRAAAERGALQIITETQLWQRLGLVDTHREIHRLYTPAMLAELLGVPLAVVRRWHRRGLIVPAREVRKLPYFDFREVATARQLAALLGAGVSPRAIEKKLETLARYLPGVQRPLGQLSTIVEGKEILLRQGDGLIEPGGQLRLDFAAAGSDEEPPGEFAAAPDAAADAAPPATIAFARRGAENAPPPSPEELCALAAELEEAGALEPAAETYRAALATGGPTPEICFQLAELLYRLGDLGGARERYYLAIELDEDYVEARANLGCVLAETGRRELAVAAFEGALRFHPDYADVHYHLAQTLDELDRREAAEQHYQAFLDLAPDSPWAADARSRLFPNPLP